MPRKFHQLSKGDSARRARRRRPLRPGLTNAVGAPSPSPASEPLADTIARGASPPATEGRERALPPPRQAATHGVSSPAPKKPVYLTQESKHLRREFRNIMLLTLAMSLVIVVLSFFLR